VFFILKCCTDYLISFSDLPSEVTICCKVAVPGINGNEYSSSIDGRLIQQASLNVRDLKMCYHSHLTSFLRAMLSAEGCCW
jgi:hypothetical protein